MRHMRMACSVLYNCMGGGFIDRLDVNCPGTHARACNVAVKHFVYIDAALDTPRQHLKQSNLPHEQHTASKCDLRQASQSDGVH